MFIDDKKIKSACENKHGSLQKALKAAGVSRTAYYSLCRKKFLLPRSLEKLAAALQVPVFTLVSNEPPEVRRLRQISRKVAAILKRHPEADPDNLRHAFLLLDEPPEKRLDRALRRGRIARH